MKAMPSDVDKGRFLALELESKEGLLQVVMGINYVEGRALQKQIYKAKDKQIYECVESK